MTRLSELFLVATLCIATANLARAEQPSVDEEGDIAAITLARIDAPEKFKVENRGGPLELLALPGFIATKNIERNRADDLKAQLAESKFDVQQELTEAILREFKGNGMQVSTGETIRYVEGDPYAIDYKASAEAHDKILVVQFENVGLYAGRLTKQFAPRLNISFELIDKATENDLFSKWFYYGADAKQDSDDQVTAQAKYAYSSYGEAIERKDELTEAFREGIAKISHLAALQIRSVVIKK